MSCGWRAACIQTTQLAGGGVLFVTKHFSYAFEVSRSLHIHVLRLKNGWRLDSSLHRRRGIVRQKTLLSHIRGLAVAAHSCPAIGEQLGSTGLGGRWCCVSSCERKSDAGVPSVLKAFRLKNCWIISNKSVSVARDTSSLQACQMLSRGWTSGVVRSPGPAVCVSNTFNCQRRPPRSCVLVYPLNTVEAPISRCRLPVMQKKASHISVPGKRDTYRVEGGKNRCP